VKNFDQFEFAFQPSIDEREIRELRTPRFIHEASNVIFLGPPGVGQTHLSVSFPEGAIQAGFGAYFMTAHDLVHDLGRAYREGPAGPADARVSGAKSPDHRRNGLSAAR
jgi:DNA replication protein DnaC